MSGYRKSFSRFLSFLLILALLLTVFPATAESPATPTDLLPAEEITEATEQAPAQEPPENPEQPQAPGQPEAQTPPETPADEPVAEPDTKPADEPAAQPPEEETFTPYAAFLKAGARLYADKDCYRRRQLLGEEAVVLVAQAEENNCEIIYAYLDVEDRTVPGRAWVHSADLTPLTDEELEAWQKAEHADALERRGLQLEPVTFGTETVQSEPEGDAETDQNNEPETEPEPAPETEPETEPEPEPQAEDAVPAGDEAEGGAATEETEEPVEKAAAEPAFATGRLAAEDVEGKEATPEAEVEWAATTTDLTAAADTYILNGSEVTHVTPVLPAVRNQNPYGTCWAFSAVGGMEIYLIKKGFANSSIDLSELFLAYFVYHVFPDAKPGGEGDTVEPTAGTEENDYLEIGGTNLLAIRVLENLIGTVNESTVPYSSAPNPPTSYSPIAAQLTGAYIVNVGESNKDEIKKLIQDHGAVGASVYMPAEYNKILDAPDGGKIAMKWSTLALYGTTARANHDVLLVGWDDNFPKTNFVEGLRPQNNGAWKVRNSWGSGWGSQNGYFWISYEDKALTATEGTAYSAVSTKSSENEEVADFCYSYSKIPDSDGYEESTAWVLKQPSPVTMTQTFTMDGNEKILSVGVETGTPNVTIRADVNVDGTNYSGSVTAKYKGFYRIKLSPQPVLSGKKKVTVTITYTHAKKGTEIIIPYEPGDKKYTVGGAYRYTTHSASGGFTLNGKTISNSDSCIKVYTKKDTSQGVQTVVMKCTSPSLSGTTISIADARVGKKIQLTTALTPATGVDTTIRWTSTNPAAATVSQTGLVTPCGHGTTEIIATSVTGVRAVCTVTVPKVKPTGIQIEGYGGASLFTISNTNAGTFTLGKTLTIYANLNPDYTTETDVTWESSDPTVMKIEATGYEDGNPRRRFCRFQVLKNGRSTITVKSKSNTSAKTSLTLVFDLVTGVKLDRSSCTLNEGDSTSLIATVQPLDARSRDVTWSTSNSAVATVDGTGRVRGVKDGTAVITATTKLGGFKATCTVTVKTKDPIEAFVYRMYRVCLQREPDPAGFRDWVTKLRNKERTGAQIASGFYNSREMKERGLSNAAFVTRAYEGIMGRTPDAAGLADWTSRLDKGVSYGYIVAGFTNSKEFTQLCASYGIERGNYKSTQARDKNLGITGYVSRLYTKMLGRGYDEGGLNNWCQKILDNPTKATALNVALSGFMHSQEFRKKGLSDIEFVKVCYRTFLNREYDEAGLRDWVGRLARGASRDQVAAGFANSREFSQIMAQYGLK